MNVPATNTRLPMSSRSQISPLVILGMLVRGDRGTNVVCLGNGFGSGRRGASLATVRGLTTAKAVECSPTGGGSTGPRVPAAVPMADGPVGVSHQRADLVPCRGRSRRCARRLRVAGGVHVCAVEDLSDQEFTSQELACVTATVGELGLPRWPWWRSPRYWADAGDRGVAAGAAVGGDRSSCP